jgi:hypothetical protein
MKKRRPKPRRVFWLWLVAAAGVAGIALAVWLALPRGAAPANTFPLPPYSASRFLNTGADARYVGTAACAGCHDTNHKSYLLTAHSRSLSDLDPRSEPPDGSFVHQLSGRSYRVYRQDGKLRHEEVVRSADGKEIGRVDLPVRYLVGSGHFSRTYLVEVDGFLHESPITWYESKREWGMSPGYDVPQPMGFDRPIVRACLSCHAGAVEAAGTVNRIAIRESAIGCESCHGPGSLHAARHKDRAAAGGGEDLTIVNPKRLSRPELESVCAACHLNGPARAVVRGRRPGDFRPGLPLTDFRVEYHFDRGDEDMTVVGHMEQLRRSACYQKSADLTCLTCHDPHADEKPKDVLAFHRQKCLSCHTAQACKSDPAERHKQEDHCTVCHTPATKTDIPHIAFTHHRIGRHGPKPASEDRAVPDLVPTDDVAHLSPLDRDRNLGLAYLEAAGRPEYARFAETFLERSRTLLEGVHAAGLREGATSEGLAWIFLKSDPARSKSYAREAVNAADASPDMRANALLHLAGCEADDRHPEAAIPLLKELVGLRRGSEEWGLLGMCYLMQNQPREALPALQQALALRPDSYPVHVMLVQAYRQLGDVQRAMEHQEKAQWLSQQRKQ